MNEAQANVPSAEAKAEPELPHPDPPTHGAVEEEPLRALARALTEALESPASDNVPANHHADSLAVAAKWDVRLLKTKGSPSRKLSED